MIYYEVKNKSGRTIASNIKDCPVLDQFIGKETESVKFKNSRNVYRENETGKVRLIIVNENDFQASNRLVNRVLNVYFDLIPEFKKLENSHRQYFDTIIDRFAHNLIKVTQRLKAHLTRLAPDSVGEKSATYVDFKSEVERRLKGNTFLAADDICQISNRITDLDAQIEGLRIICGFADRVKPSFVNSSISRAIIRLYHPFLKEFEKKSIKINLQIPQKISDENKVRLDYQLFSVIMWQFFDNAIKYARPNSEIIFKAELDKDPKVLYCEMTSLLIEQDEIDKVFQEKYKGKNAKDITGDGIGMFMIKRALDLMGASLIIEPDIKTLENYNDKKYCKNLFTFKFKTNHKK